MACRERISNPSSARLAVSKTKDISCDDASHLLWPSLCDETGEVHIDGGWDNIHEYFLHVTNNEK